MAITIPSDATKTVKGIGSSIKYFVNTRNFSTLDKMFEKYKKDHTSATIEDYFTSNKENIYVIVDNDYVKTSDTSYNKNTYYYMEDGTQQINCPACSRINPKGTIAGEDGVQYTCPKCNGKGIVYHTTNAVKVMGITVAVNDQTTTGYSIHYKIVPYGGTKSVLVDDKDLYNE